MWKLINCMEKIQIMKLVFILMTKRLEFFSKSDARYSLELECARSSNARACSNSNVLDHLMLELARYPNFLMLAHPYYLDIST